MSDPNANALYLPYREPAVSTILIFASFILLLHVVNTAVDRLLYCGLIGQILVGIAWGIPGANWLSREAQETIVQLGYLGLILLVYEGGLSTSLSSVRQHIWLSLGVATTGIVLPIALSFVLIPLLNVSAVQAFAAGAALCSTSLGTTFTVLSTCNLIKTRLGTVLTTAAMLDDVVGLIMVQVVSELGASGGNIGAGTILRPVGVSFAVVFVLVLVCRYAVKPLTRWLLPRLAPVLRRTPHAALIMQSLFLIGIFAGATYAGTSGLFAAYLVGVVMTWWDKSCFPNAVEAVNDARTSSSQVFESSYAAVTTLLLKPFFFASIGFSIPITQLFSSSVVWRGIVYTLLMLFGKLATGAWLVRFSKSTRAWFDSDHTTGSLLTRRLDDRIVNLPLEEQATNARPLRTISAPANVAVRRDPIRTSVSGSGRARPLTAAGVRRPGGTATQPSTTATRTASSNGGSATLLNPISLYPPCLLGLAMAARGEIGYLIASVAEASGIYASEGDGAGASRLFLVVIWAVSLCTLIGPVCVGLLIRRVRRLERESGEQEGRRVALGIWGVGHDE